MANIGQIRPARGKCPKTISGRHVLWTSGRPRAPCSADTQHLAFSAWRSSPRSGGAMRVDGSAGGMRVAGAVVGGAAPTCWSVEVGRRSPQRCACVRMAGVRLRAHGGMPLCVGMHLHAQFPARIHHQLVGGALRRVAKSNLASNVWVFVRAPSRARWRQFSVIRRANCRGSVLNRARPPLAITCPWWSPDTGCES